MQDCYGAGVEEIDFGSSEQARQIINGWVEQQTRDKIKELLQPGVLDANTRLVLASAIYFKGDWIHAFPKERSLQGEFHIAAGKAVNTTLMSQQDQFGYGETDDTQILSMAYRGGRHALVVLLPKKRDGLPDLEKLVTADLLAGWMGQVREQEVRVTLPQFRLTAEFSLVDVLVHLGMKQAFISGEADISGMNGGHDLYVTAVMHKAFVDVNEEGTEAAAATAVAVGSLGIGQAPAPVPVFRADHPFLFAIVDVHTGVVMFLGRLVQP